MVHSEKRSLEAWSGASVGVDMTEPPPLINPTVKTGILDHLEGIIQLIWAHGPTDFFPCNGLLIILLILFF